MSARGIAYAGLGLGLGASLAANVLSVTQRAGTDAPDAAALVGAAFWPLALLITSELLLRSRPAGTLMDAVSAVAVGAVALGAGWISWTHTHALLVSWGESAVGAALGASAVDGLLVASAQVLWLDARTRTRTDAPGCSGTDADAGAPLDAPRPDADAPTDAPAPDTRTHPDAPASDAPAPRPDAPRTRGRTTADARTHPDALTDDDLVTLAVAAKCTSVRSVQRECGIGRTRAQRVLEAMQVPS